MSEDPYKPPESNLAQPLVTLENPHSLPSQLAGILISAVIVIALSPVSGVLVSLTGIFIFLDAWNSGIYKDPEKKALTNVSPMGWGISVMLIWFIAYPVYLLNRNKLKTRDGPRAYWILGHITSAIILMLLATQLFLLLTGFPVD